MIVWQRSFHEIIAYEAAIDWMGLNRAELALDTLEKLQFERPRIIHRFTIEHFGVSTPERTSQIAGLGTLKREGVILVLHSDFAMAPVLPPYSAWVAVNRIAESGATLGETECIDLETAIRTITIDAAYVIGMEHEIGSIRTADLILLTKTDIVTSAKAAVEEKWIGSIAPDARIIWKGTDNLHSGSLVLPAPISCEDLTRRLEHLPPSIHRVKGFFLEKSRWQMTLVQRVRGPQTFSPAPADAKAGPVLIAVGLHADPDQAMKLLSTPLPATATSVTQKTQITSA